MTWLTTHITTPRAATASPTARGNSPSMKKGMVTLWALAILIAVLPFSAHADALPFDSYTPVITGYNNGYVPAAVGLEPWTGSGTAAYLQLYGGVFGASPTTGHLQLKTMVGASLDCQSAVADPVYFGMKQNWWDGSGSPPPAPFGFTLTTVPVSGTQ